MSNDDRRARVLLADDHKIVAEGIRSLLEPEFNLIGTAEDGRQLLKACEKECPDVVVMDISMPLLNGIEAARQLKKMGCDAKIIFLTMHPDAVYGRRAFEAGASGYVLKHSAPSELVHAIRQALQGRVYVTPLIAREVLQSLMDKPSTSDDELNLTARQREVLQLLAEGLSAKEVASVLNISPRTVEFHKYQMMEKLSLSSSAELLQFAIKHGIVSV